MPEKNKKSVDLKPFAKEVISIIHSVHAELLRQQPRVMASSRVTFPQMVVTDILRANKQCKMSDFSKTLGITKSAVTGLIDRLRAEGLIKTIRSRSDRRIVNVALTPKGLRFAKVLSDYKSKVIETLFKNITPRERMQYLRVMRKLRKNLNTGR